MLDDQTSRGTQHQNLHKAREILDGISKRRSDPRVFKTTETESRTKGGQSTVILGKISFPEQVATSLPKDQLKQFLELQFAIKKLKWKRENAEASAKFFKSFVNEVRIMAQLSHPSTAHLLGFIEEVEGDAWIILPWEANGNVREFLQSGKWDIPERVSLVQDVINGVEYLHTRQPPICHGDLKSLNILVNSAYHAVITDFGSARLKQNMDPTKDDSAAKPPPKGHNGNFAQDLPSPKINFNPATLELTLTGPGFSLRWTAPEVLNNGVQDLPSDMWAVGWICWEILTGRLPFEEHKTGGLIISHIIKGRLPAIREEAQLSPILKLCNLMSDCCISKPIERIDASMFQRKVRLVPSTTPSSSTSGDAKVRSAALLHALGDMYCNQDNTAMAESHYQSAIDTATRTKDDKSKGNASSSLGKLYRAQSRYNEAEEAFMEAHGIHSRIGNDLRAAEALDGLANTYRHQSRYRDAEKAFTEAHEIHSRINNDLGAANALNGLGNTYDHQSRYREAEKAFTQAHEIHTHIGNDLGTATSLQGLGHIYRAQSKNQAAEKAFTEAHEIHSRIGNRRGVANALFGLGDTYRALSKAGEAEKAFNDAHSIYSCIGDHLGTGNTLLSLAMFYRGQGRYDDLEVFYRRAAASYDHAEDGEGRAKTLFDLAKYYHSQQRYLEAEDTVTEVLAIRINIGNDKGQARASWLLSRIFNSQSKYDKAKEALAQAEAVFARTGDDALRAKTLDDLGDVHLAQGTYDEAEECYRLAQAIFSTVGDVRGEATELLSLGTLYRSQGRSDEAEECCAEARVRFARVGDAEGEVEALDRLMGLYALAGRYFDAKAACEEAREMYAQMGQPMSDLCAATWELLQGLDQPTGST